MTDSPRFEHGASKRKREMRAQRAAEKPQYDEFEEMREERRKRGMEKAVGWVLTIVFAVTSMGFLASMRSPGGNRVERKQLTPEAIANESIKAQQARAAENPTDPGPHFEMARDYEKLRDREKQLDELRKVLELDPSHAEALRTLSRALIAEGKVPEALDVLKKGTEAERAELAKRNKVRPQDEPEMQPDAVLRALLVQCYVTMGPAGASKARAAAVEGLTVQPNEFAQAIVEGAFRLVLMQKKPQALALLDLSIKEARAGKYDEVATQLQEMRGKLETFKIAPPGAAPAPSPAASGAPQAEATAPASPQAAASAPGPASPEASPSAAASASPQATPATSSPAAAEPAAAASPSASPEASPKP